MHGGAPLTPVLFKDQIYKYLLPHPTLIRDVELLSPYYRCGNQGSEEQWAQSHRTGKNKDLNPMLTSHPGLYSTPQNKSNYKKLFSRKGRREWGKGTKRKEEAENAECLCLSATEWSPWYAIPPLILIPSHESWFYWPRFFHIGKLAPDNSAVKRWTWNLNPLHLTLKNVLFLL